MLKIKDTLIGYAAYAEKFGFTSKYAYIKLLLGTKYVPLRQEFCMIGKVAKIMPKYFGRAYRENLSVKMQELVDGRGAGRIAEILM